MNTTGFTTCPWPRHDVEGVVACFDPECAIELLGVQLHGRSTGAGNNHIVEEGRNLGH